ncbi:MAG: hypothetical protein ABJH45_14675 [Paracoccaceae bacterium]
METSHQTTEFKALALKALCFFVGVALALLVFALAARYLPRAPSSLFWHGTLLVVAIVPLIGLRKRNVFWLSTALGLACASVALIAHSMFWTPRVIIAEIEKFVDGTRYCLATRSGQPVTGPLDLTNLNGWQGETLDRSRRGDWDKYPMVLVVDADAVNPERKTINLGFDLHGWDDARSSFVSQSASAPNNYDNIYNVNCIPSVDWLAQKRDPEFVEISSKAAKFRIPSAHHPVAAIGTIYLSGGAPAFQPHGAFHWKRHSFDEVFSIVSSPYADVEGKWADLEAQFGELPRYEDERSLAVYDGQFLDHTSDDSELFLYSNDGSKLSGFIACLRTNQPEDSVCTQFHVIAEREMFTPIGVIFSYKKAALEHWNSYGRTAGGIAESYLLEVLDPPEKLLLE